MPCSSSGARVCAALLVASAIAVPRAADAAIYLSLSGSPAPVTDLDGVTGLADIAAPFAGPLTLDLRYTDLGGADLSGGLPGAVWGLTFGLADVFEVIPGSVGPVLAPPPPYLAPLALSSDGFSVFFEWTVVGPMLDGDLLLSVMLSTSGVGIWPDDDVGDLFLTGGTPSGAAVAPLSFDPISGGPAAFVDYDLQTEVPLPAPAALLLFGIAGLVGLRRRR